MQEQKGAITLALFGRPPQDIDKTTLTNNYKGLALCLDATLGIKADRWVPTRTPTVHRCPRGKAVGGDKRAQPKRQAPLSLTTYMVACSVQFSSARIQQRTERRYDGQAVDGQFVGSRKQPRQRTQGNTLDSGHTPDLSNQKSMTARSLISEVPNESCTQNPLNTSSTQWR